MTENIKVYTHSSIRIESSLGAIYVDPFEVPGEPHDARFIFITHDHYDHFSPDDIAHIASEETVLIVPQKMEKKAQDVSAVVSRIETVGQGTSDNIDGLSFETVPAYNLMKPFHMKSAGWVGYILNVDGKRVYIAGDTDATDEAKSVKCDIALVPIGGTYTMDHKKAAELINVIRPEIAIPTHYGRIVGNLKDGDEFAKLVKDPVVVEIKIK